MYVAVPPPLGEAPPVPPTLGDPFPPLKPCVLVSPPVAVPPVPGDDAPVALLPPLAVQDTAPPDTVPLTVVGLPLLPDVKPVVAEVTPRPPAPTE